MTNYHFELESFEIKNTRALHNDTDTASFTLKVGDHLYPTQIASLGDLNNGIHGLGMQFDEIPIDAPDTPIVFNYNISNAGNSTDGEVRSALLSSMDGMATTVFGFGLGVTLVPTPGTFVVGVWALAIAGLIEALRGLATIFTVNCDGVCAVDQIEVTRADLDAATAAIPNKMYRETRSYQEKSQSGCGSDSFYTVTWVVWPQPDKTKEKDKEKEKEKETKESDKPAAKDHKDYKDGTDAVIEHSGAPAGVLDRLAESSTSTEIPPATGQAFIRVEERPPVGKHVLQQPDQNKGADE